MVLFLTPMVTLSLAGGTLTNSLTWLEESTVLLIALIAKLKNIKAMGDRTVNGLSFLTCFISLSLTPTFSFHFNRNKLLYAISTFMGSSNFISC